MTQQNVAPPGSQTFVHGTVLSVLFNTMVNKRAGGTYEGTTLNFQDTRGQGDSQSWATSIIDDPRSIEIRNALIALQGAPGAQFTIHKTKNDKGYWNVDSIDFGFVEGTRTAPAAAPVAASPVVLPGQPASAPAAAYVANDDSKMRSKEQCMRGEAMLAAASFAAPGSTVANVIETAEIMLNYITNGIATPVAAPVAALVAAPAAEPAPVVAPAAETLAPVITVAAPAPAPVPPAPIPAAPAAAIPAPVVAPVAAAPAPAPVTAPAPGAPAPTPDAPVAAVVAQPGVVFDDGFGGAKAVT